MTESETAELERAIRDISDIASRLGLDPFPIHFEVVPANIMHEMGAYGVPGRFSHWTNGRSYQHSKTMHEHGLTKVYEMVINSNPAYAFLLDTNPVLQNKVVAAHVQGHCDFFKNNAYFSHTDRNSIDAFAAHADRIRGYEYEHGVLEVERFLDAVLSIDYHVDPHANFRRRDKDEKIRELDKPETDYDDLFNIGIARKEKSKEKPKFPLEPELDLLLFIAEYSRALDDWQRDIVHIIRNEALYFSPQYHTKVINEGWASYVHTRIMRELDITSDEYVQFSKMHAGITDHAPNRFNPYALGMAIFEDIEQRWDDPSKEELERDPTRQKGQGRAKIMEVRRFDNDVSLIRNYFTAEVCESQQLYTYERNEDGELTIVDRDWEKVRGQLIGMLSNAGRPYILIENGDYRTNGELLLRHQFEGKELDMPYAEQVLKAIWQLWGRPVHLATYIQDKATLMTYDGVHKRAEREP